MKLGKIINGALIFKTYIDLEGNGVIVNPNEAQFLENGFREVTYSKMPILQPNQGVIEEYEVTETQIKVNYKIVDVENNL